MVYATEADIEGYMIEAFSGTTPITSTDIIALLGQLSDLVDAIDNVTEDFYASNTPMRVKMAVVTTAAEIINQIKKGDEATLTHLQIRALMEKYLATTPDRTIHFAT